jgi:copper homeostasis protein
MVEVEICCFSLASSKVAAENGASRIELCGGFLEGGTTPSHGLIKSVLAAVDIPVFVMIRPRGGDFCYTMEEQEVIKSDIENIKELNPSGFVFGALRASGEVDVELCEKVISWAKPYPITFHRAIDVSNDMEKALEQIIALGFERVLTSGGENDAFSGLEKLKVLNAQAGGRIQIMAGAGVNASNADKFVAAGIGAVHGTGKLWQQSKMEFKNEKVNMASGQLPDEFGRFEADSETVKAFIQKANSL